MFTNLNLSATAAAAAVRLCHVGRCSRTLMLRRHPGMVDLSPRAAELSLYSYDDNMEITLHCAYGAAMATAMRSYVLCFYAGMRAPSVNVYDSDA